MKLRRSKNIELIHPNNLTITSNGCVTVYCNNGRTPPINLSSGDNLSVNWTLKLDLESGEIIDDQFIYNVRQYESAEYYLSDRVLALEKELEQVKKERDAYLNLLPVPSR